MAEKEYIVSLHKGADKNLILSDLNRDTSLDDGIDSSVVPDRTVSIINTRPASKRMFHVSLTEEEAIALENHPNVGGLNTPLEWDDEWLDYEQEENWTRDNSSTIRGNWGLRRHIQESNLWGTGSQNVDPGGVYPYHLDGTGVDYIHQESKFRFDHEQWQDRDGNSRLVPFQWNTLSGMSSIPTIDYTNTSGSSYHATHCAGIAVGKDYGWGKNANVYCLPMDIVSSSLWFDAIKEFHRTKETDPVTGVKRPTVVGASWGYKAYFTSMTAINFRGTDVGTVKNNQYGMIGDSSNRFNANLYNLNAEVEEMQDGGVHYLKSAGNQGQKLCYSGDIDYNNYILRSVATGGVGSGNPVYYNRGAGNIGPDTIVVGNIDSALYSSSEACQAGSDKGPRVDVYAAGTDIISATNSSSTAVANYTGTSMSTPQVSGMSCLVLQLNPGWSPAQLRKWWQDTSVKGLLFQGSVDENTPSTFFANSRNLMSPDATSNRIASFGFAAAYGLDVKLNNTGQVAGPLVSDASNGAVFDRSLTVNGLKLVAAGAVGGGTTVPDEWVKKTAKSMQLITNPGGEGIVPELQDKLIATLQGDPGTFHAGLPAAQRIGYGGESSYSPNWLLDAGIPSYTGYQAFLDSHLVNDMVFYHGTPGDLNPSTSDRDIEEMFEHIFHTVHMFGIPGVVPGSEDEVVMGVQARLDFDSGFDWTGQELHLAMKEAINAGLYDPSGYSTLYDTNAEAAELVYKEYTYLVNWSMWNMSEFWDGGSLSPEWSDTLKTPAGMLANNPLGYALFNKYFAPVLSKPRFETMRAIFLDVDLGVSGYTPNINSGFNIV
jgi:hypothetical protein